MAPLWRQCITSNGSDYLPGQAKMKPRIFIGSSTEGKPVADAIHSELQREAECTVWTHGIFGLSATNIENLKRQVDTSEFGIFVFSADDAVTMRGKLFSVPRDNVVYELGLFSGALGRERCFFVTPQGTDIHLPTDLLGMTAGWYETGRRDENLQAAVAPFCTMVCQKIRELTLGLSFVRPEPTARLRAGWQTFTCQCAARPARDVFLVTQKGDRWLPRQEKLELTTCNEYEVKTYFSETDLGRITVHLVKTTRDLAMLWIESYCDIVDQAKQYRAHVSGASCRRGFSPLPVSRSKWWENASSMMVGSQFLPET
jgi:predicted nucleotide-binding protein